MNERKIKNKKEIESESKNKEGEREKSIEVVITEAIIKLQELMRMYTHLLEANAENEQIVIAINNLLVSINKMVIDYTTLTKGVKNAGQ